MSTADGKVVIDTQLNNKGFIRGIRGLRGQIGGLRSVVGRLGATIASAFAVRAIVNFGKECVELGSNIAEVQNVVDTAFGDMSYKVEQFAETAIQNFGMSRLAAKKTASTYMAMAKGMGIADEAASNMAISLAGLTGDVASFYNISQEAADTKLKSVFTGETESLKELGVVMTQANLKAYALEQGITKDLTAMTQAELVALRYGYVMKSLSLAQGDFAKTSDSWANQTRILSMQWQEFMSIVGQTLITVLTPAVKVLNQLVSSLISVATAVNSVVATIFGKQAVQQSGAAAVTAEISESVEQQNALTEATEDTAKAQQGFLAGFDEITKVNEDSSSGSVGVGTIDTSGVTALADSADELEGSGLLPFFEKLGTAMAPVKELLTQIVDTGKVLFTEIQTIFTRIWSEAIAPALSLIKDIWLDAWNTVVDVWEKYGAPIFDKIREAIQGASDTLQNVWESIILPIWETIMEVVDKLWTEHLQPLWEKILEFIAMLVDGALDIYNKFILPLYNWFVDKLGGPISAVISSMIEQLGNFLGVVADVAGYIVDILKGVIDFVVGVFTGDWERAFNGVAEIFEGVMNIMITFVESFVNFFVRGINKVISAANSLSFDVPDWIPGIGGDTWGFNIPKVSEIKLPRLATGAVIPPNREFLAVLGDQTSGNNIETPEALLRKIVREEGGSRMSDSILREILVAIREGHVIVVDNVTLGKVLKKSAANATKASGTSTL